MQKCVFLDRDGVINRERGDYTYKPEDFEIIDGVVESISHLKKSGYLLIIITNQAGIAKGIYTAEDVMHCHNYLQKACNSQIDAIYYCPYHPDYSNSLCRKPDSLMFEKAIARFKIDPSGSWMIGDSERDIIPAKKLGLHTIRIGNNISESTAEYMSDSLRSAVSVIDGSCITKDP